MTNLKMIFLLLMKNMLELLKMEIYLTRQLKKIAVLLCMDAIPNTKLNKQLFLICLWLGRLHQHPV